jgi:hypothetical protein
LLSRQYYVGLTIEEGVMAGKSILDGVYLAIDRWLNIDDIGQPPHHRHRLAWQKVGDKPRGSTDGYQLMVLST